MITRTGIHPYRRDFPRNTEQPSGLESGPGQASAGPSKYNVTHCAARSRWRCKATDYSGPNCPGKVPKLPRTKNAGGSVARKS